MATSSNLRARLAVLESSEAPSREPLLILREFVGAKDGAPDGRRTDWDAHADLVIVQGEVYAVGADESALQAVERIVAAMNPRPQCVRAYVPLDASPCPAA